MANTLPEGTRLGPYEIIGLLGAGGMGEVYRARDPRLGRTVAIKILPSEFSADANRSWRFEREAKAVASLNHPHICTVHDIGDHEGHRYLVMEMMEGQPLDQRLSSGPLPLPQLLDLAVQIADALEAAHSAGVIHRDLKPGNIFITKRGEAKLLDFGLAKLTDEAGASHATSVGDMAGAPTTISPDQTTFGSILGTAAYMSPEQARGEAVGAPSDLFSFGVVLYEMATGRPAFTGKTTAVLFDAILNRQPPPIASVNAQLPLELSHIVEKALEKDPDLRYQSAADMRADLKRLRRDSAAGRVAESAAPLVAPSSLPAVPAAGTSQGTLTAGPADVVEAVPSGKRTSKRRRNAILLGILILVIVRSRFCSDRSDDEARRARPFETLEVTQLTTTGNAFRPVVSADGKYVVYLQEEKDGVSLWLRQIAATSSVKLVAADGVRSPQAATIGPDGTFVDYMRSDGLWRVPFLGGTPRQIADRVNTPAGWSPDGRRMAFVRPSATGRGQDLVTANVDGGDIQTVASGVVFATGLPGGTIFSPAWSPDGRHVAMFERLSEDVRDIGVRVFDIRDGGSEVVKTRGDVPLGLAWFDKRTLLIAQALETGTPSQLWRIAVPDGTRTKLSNDVNRYSELSLSADTDTLVTSRPEMRVGIWVGDAKGNGANVVAPAAFLSSAFYYATVDWDGASLLFTHTLNGQYEIFRVDPVAGDQPTSIAAGREFSTAADGTIVFRAVGDQDGLWKVGRDGQRPVRLATGTVSYPFISADGRSVVFSSRLSGIQTLWYVPGAGGEATPLLKVPVSINGFSDISPDGRSIIFGRSDRWTLCELPTCGNQKDVAPLLGVKPRWMPDGRGFAYIDSFNPSGNLWMQPLDGSAPRQITHFNDGQMIGHYAWSKDGKQLAVSRATQASDIVLFRGLTGKRK